MLVSMVKIPGAAGYYKYMAMNTSTVNNYIILAKGFKNSYHTHHVKMV